MAVHAPLLYSPRIDNEEKPEFLLENRQSSAIFM